MSTHTDEHALPVFVLGLQRSGTTWLANLISHHPEMTCIGSVDHQGIHESIFFSHFARAYGDLNDDENYSRFMHDFVSSDYYVLSGLEPEWLDQRRPRTYGEAFRLLMDEVAKRRCAKGWVEKSPHHTLLATQLEELYPDAKFICVIRNYHEMIRSRLWAYGRTPPAYPERLYRIARACASNSLYERHLQRFCKNNPKAILLSYETLKNDTIGQINEVFGFLGLEPVESGFDSAYAPNSSFSSSRHKQSGLSSLDKAIIVIFKQAMKLLPYNLLAQLERNKRSSGIDWPEWCWKINPRPSVH